MTKSEMLLGRLIEERLTPGANVADVDRRIREAFEEDWCIVFTHMAMGREHRDSVIAYLCSVHEMKRMTRPIIEAGGGIVVKTIADRFIAIFKRPHDALKCLLQVNRRLASYNEGLGPEDRVGIGAGMGFGRLLKVGDDLFGAESGRAFRLGGGEIVAPYEILLTDATRAALLHTPNVTFEPIKRDLGFSAFRAKYDLRSTDSRPPYRPLVDAEE